MINHDQQRDQQAHVRESTVWMLESWRVHHLSSHIMQPELVRRVWNVSAYMISRIAEELPDEQE